MIRSVCIMVLLAPSMAMALSCYDLVRIDQPYRYRDLLERFVSNGQVTYAQAKAARTGSLQLPDGYFAMAPQISQAYRQGEPDQGSLLVQLAAGRFGAARPLPLTDNVMTRRIIGYYASLLGDPLHGKGSLVDAWHYPGKTGFLTMDGSPLTGLPPALMERQDAEPLALGIGPDGELRIVPEVPQAGQIVVLPGMMDCAVRLEDQPMTSDIPIEPTPTALFCGIDRDGDGSILGQEEQAPCSMVTGQALCPLDQVPCLEQIAMGGCPNGTSYDPGSNRCIQAATATCPDGYSLATNGCQAPSNCPSGFTLTAGVCSVAATPSCPSGSTLTGMQCLETPRCTEGATRIAASLSCRAPGSTSCPVGSSFDANSMACLTAPLCGSGQYDPNTNACSSPASKICPDGMTMHADGTHCLAVPSCPSGYSYQTARDRCEKSVPASAQTGLGCKATSFPCISGAASCCHVNISCPDGASGPVKVDASYCCLGSASITISKASDFLTRKEISSGGYAMIAVQCTAAGSCTSYFMDRLCYNGYPLSGWLASGTFSMAVTTLSCPSGSTLQSDGSCLAVATANCSQGSLDTVTDHCQSAVNYQCQTGTYHQTSNSCLTPALCTSGSLDTELDRCLLPVSMICPVGMQYDGVQGACISTASCIRGIFSADLDRCSFPVDLQCPVGSLTGQQCYTEAGCPTGGTLQVDSKGQVCTSDQSQTCPSGMLLAGSTCSTASSCPEGYQHDPLRGLCSQGFTQCPAGPYPCLVPPGMTQPVCSPQRCFDPHGSDGESTTITTAIPEDNGPRAADGSCQGVLALFSGAGSRCRPPGLQVGMLQDCCDAGFGGGMQGNNTGAILTGLRTAWEVGQVAYYGSQLTSGSASIIGITGSGSTITSVTILTESSTVTLQGAAASGAFGAATSGASGSAAVAAGLESYSAALFNPLALSITGATLVATRILYGSGCDAQDLQTAFLLASGSCHHVGSYCAKKLPLVGCVQKAESHCCFNSRLARIIHEQGRQQLPGFHPLAPFGTATAPICRGLTPEEFQALDFGRIDLSEYIGTLPAPEQFMERMQAARQTISPLKEQP